MSLFSTTVVFGPHDMEFGTIFLRVLLRVWGGNCRTEYRGLYTLYGWSYRLQLSGGKRKKIVRDRHILYLLASEVHGGSLACSDSFVPWCLSQAAGDPIADLRADLK